MKFTIVFALLLIAAQAHGATPKGIAKNARRHDHFGKRQLIPTIPTPQPTPEPSSQPPPPPPPTSPSVTPVPSTTNPPPPPASSTAPQPTDPASTTPTSDTPSTNPDTPVVSPTNPPGSSSSNAPSSSFSTFVSTYVTTFSGSVITTQKTRTAPVNPTNTESNSATESSDESTKGHSNRPSASSGPNAGVIVGGVVAGVLVVFGLIIITIRLFRRNNRLDRRSKALATEIEMGLDAHPPRSSGPTGPSMVHRQFVPPAENADEYQYRPAEYDPERYYQNVQAQQAGSSPLQAYLSRPFSPTPVPYSRDVLPPPQHQGQMNHIAASNHETRTEGNITYASAPSSPSMRSPSVPPYAVADPNQYKPNEMNGKPDNMTTMARKPDVVDY